MKSPHSKYIDCAFADYSILLTTQFKKAERKKGKTGTGDLREWGLPSCACVCIKKISH
jgi:hypothetical protein